MTRGLFHTVPPRPGPVTLSELRHARWLAAIVVRDFGEKYLPIFERLDAECEAMERKEMLLQRAHEIASGEDPGKA